MKRIVTRNHKQKHNWLVFTNSFTLSNNGRSRNGWYGRVPSWLQWFSPIWHVPYLVATKRCCVQGHTLCVRMLLSEGAEKSTINAQGKTPVQLGEAKGFSELAALIEGGLGAQDELGRESVSWSPCTRCSRGSEGSVPATRSTI
jgi:hypothetical protein